MLTVFPLTAGVNVKSNGASMDRVFEEEEEEGERGRGGGGGLGVGPVLATSYSANDVSHLQEEESSLQMIVPRYHTPFSPSPNQVYGHPAGEIIKFSPTFE